MKKINKYLEYLPLIGPLVEFKYKIDIQIQGIFPLFNKIKMI